MLSYYFPELGAMYGSHVLDASSTAAGLTLNVVDTRSQALDSVDKLYKNPPHAVQDSTRSYIIIPQYS